MGEHEIELSSDQLYFIEPDGSASLMGNVTDTSVECPDDDDAYTRAFKHVAAAAVDATWVFDMFMLMERYRIVNRCPDRRVAHLALYGKTARIRKKNFNRAIKILEELDD